jgi:DedD protein
MAENRKGKGKRYYFSRAQMILLGGGFVVSAAIIFFLGMVVGKGIEERKIVKAEEPLVKIPVKPTPSPGGSSALAQPKEELTFYDTLTKSPPPAAIVEEKSKPSSPAEKTSRQETKETKVKVAAADPPRKPEKPPAEKSNDKARAKKLPDKEKAPEKVASLRTVEKEKEPETAVDEEAKNKRLSADSSENNNEPGRWTIQVNAFPDEKSAKTWVEKLKSKGYNAYMTEVKNKGKTWYRVRVGRFASREEAQKMEEALKTKENLPKVFATNQKLDG